MLLNQIKHSLRTKLILVSICTHLAILLLIIINLTLLVDTLTQRYITNRIDELYPILNDTFTPYIIHQDKKNLRVTMKSMLTMYKGLDYILILDTQQKTYLYTAETPSPPPKIDKSLAQINDKRFDTRRPLIFQNQKLAEIQIGVNLKHFLFFQQELVQQTIFIGLFGGLILTIFLLKLLGHVVTRHIDILLKSTRSVTAGDYTTLIPIIQGNDEISELSKNFNQMVEAIRQHTDALKESEAKYKSLVDHIPQRIYLKNTHSYYLSCNKNYAQDLNIDENMIKGCNDHDFYPPQLANKYIADDQRIITTAKTETFEEVYIINKEERLVHMVKTPVKDKQGNVVGILGIFWDITENKYAQERIHRLSHYDKLTALPNRDYFHQQLNKTLSQHTKQPLALLLLDIDRFKSVNDSLGHQYGDRLLHVIGQRLMSLCENKHLLARFGGDEFILLMEGAKTHSQCIQDAEELAQQVLALIAQPYQLDEYEIVITVSIGITLSPKDALTSSDLLRHVDIAMYHVKAHGKNNYHFFSNQLHTDLEHDLNLEQALRKGIENKEFVLYYQPQINLSTGKLVGVEALIRWIHPTKGLVSPNDFIPLAEETGLILPLGEWCLHTACQQYVAWQKKGLVLQWVAVNICPQQVYQPHFIPLIKQLLDHYQMPANALELEITENTIMEDNAKTLETLEALRAIGVRLAIDDFGTGYSSMGYLKRFPLQTLKIDQSFVRDILTDSHDAAIVISVINLAKNLGLHTIAEGIETKMHLNYLKTYHCELGQGYYFSPALPAQELEQYAQKKYFL